MSSSMFITIDSKDFPNDINGINNLFRQANKIYGEFEYRYYLIFKICMIKKNRIKLNRKF